jgi:hypothetical protein
MSNNQEDDWETSAAAQRRKGFFETTPSGSSRPADPSRDVDLPARPRRRQTPHPKAGTSGLDAQQQSEYYASSSRDPYRSADQHRQPGDGHASTSYDHVAQDRRRRESPARSTTKRDVSRDGFDGAYEQRNTEQDDRRSGQASSNTKKKKKQVGFEVNAGVSYPKRYSPGSESSSVSDQEERPEEPSGGQLGAGQPHVQVGQLRYDHTQARDTADWETGKGEQSIQRTSTDRIRRSQDGKLREEDTVRQRERRDEKYSEERSSNRLDRRSGERSRRSDDRRSDDRRRSDEKSDERRRRDDSHERRDKERRRRRAETSRDIGQASEERRRHHERRRERSRTPPGKMEKFKNYFTRSK